MTKSQTSIATHYHERTKYAPQTIAGKNRNLDWASQPQPYKEYKIGTHFDLKPYLPAQGNDPAVREWRRLSQFLLCSYGVTAKLPTLYGPPLYLRAAPSAGGLYPGEIYLLSRGTQQLPPGLYNYQVRTHSLLQFWSSDVWPQLQGACFFHPALAVAELALVATAVFFRSAWRYEDRAYRRVCLDTGHLLGNLELAGAIAGYRPCAIGGFADAAVNELLYLDLEQEGAMAVIPLLEPGQQDNKEAWTTALPSQMLTDIEPVDDGELLGYFHWATRIEASEEAPTLAATPCREDKYNFPFCLKVSTKTTPIDCGPHLSVLEKTLLRRRSTRAYSGEDLTLDELNWLLHFTYQFRDYAPQQLDGSPDFFALDWLETFVAVSGVAGLEAGCYYYAPKAQELRQIRFKNFRRELHYLCLGQELGRDAAAVVFHTADLPKAVAQFGDRVYRYLHLDAGHLGQRLNLAAIHLGLGASGIGGFFDDQVNEVLGIPADEAVIYITTLGRPRQDIP
ncbi:MAG: SagB/ThcOx family dehydrogenase [Chloroflexaceae bacterium]|nr:SagB/ThcOx family dehydrogenase [Chloroflexaceae bacterium]